MRIFVAIGYILTLTVMYFNTYYDECCMFDIFQLVDFF